MPRLGATVSFDFLASAWGGRLQGRMVQALLACSLTLIPYDITLAAGSTSYYDARIRVCSFDRSICFRSELRARPFRSTASCARPVRRFGREKIFRELMLPRGRLQYCIVESHDFLLFHSQRRRERAKAKKVNQTSANFTSTRLTVIGRCNTRDMKVNSRRAS